MHESLDPTRRLRIDLAEHRVDFAVRVEDEPRRPVLVLEGVGQHGLERVRVGPMAEVVQQRRCQRNLGGVVVDVVRGG